MSQAIENGRRDLRHYSLAPGFAHGDFDQSAGWAAVGYGIGVKPFPGTNHFTQPDQHRDGVTTSRGGIGGGHAVVAFRTAGNAKPNLYAYRDHHCTDVDRPAGRGWLDRLSLQQVDERLRWQLAGLGASTWQQVLTLWAEARLPLLAALMAGFGAVISEVGASMMVGGNIKGQTRVLTTAIVLETSRGAFDRALVLGGLLVGLTFLVNWGLTVIQQRGR